jgi:hypothetical protein
VTFNQRGVVAHVLTCLAWLQAKMFALAAEDPSIVSQQGTPDSPFSLFEGQAGLLSLYYDLIHGPMQSRFPCVEL